MGYIGDREEYQGRRLMQMYMYGKNFEDDNQYSKGILNGISFSFVCKKLIVVLPNLLRSSSI